MRLSLPLVCVIGLLGFLHSAMAAEADPNALPSGAVARLGSSHLRIGYAPFVLTPDGRAIVTISPQGIVRRFDAQTSRLLERRQLTDRRDVDPVHAFPAALSADGRIAAMEEWSYAGPRVTVWDVSSGKRLFRRTSTETRRTGLGGLSSDGKQLAVIETEDKKVHLRIFDLKTGRMSEMGPFQHDMLGIHFAADGKRFIVTQQDLLQAGSITSSVYVFGQPTPHIITAFDLPSGKELWQRTVWGMSFAVSRDGKTVLASGCPNQNRWDHPGFLPNQNCSPSGFHVIRMDAESGKPTERFVSCQLDNAFLNPFGVANFVLAPDNRTVVINHFDDKGVAYIVLWDLHARKEIRRFKLQTNSVQLIPFSMAISADGRTLFTNGTNGEHLQRWDLTTGKPFFDPPPNDGLPGSFIQLAFTPDGKEIFASSYSGISGRWSLETGKRIDLIHDNYGGNPFARTPDGLRAVRHNFQERQLEFTVFDPVIRKALHTIRLVASDPVGARLDTVDPDAYALTANGKTFLAIYRNLTGKRTKDVTAWDVASGRRLSQFAVPGNPSFRRSPFSPCGRWVLLNDKLYHVASGTELFTPSGAPDERLVLGGQQAYGPVWFSEDGRLMAGHLRNNKEKSAARDTLAVWELASGEVLARFPKAGFVAQVAFAPDDCTIALLNAQGVRLEELPSGKRRAAYPAPDVIGGAIGNGCDMQGLVFAPDGRTLATAHQDGTIVLWKVPQNHAAEPIALSDVEREKLWVDLASKSPGKGRAAVERLACYPKAASLLASRFRPLPADAKLDELIKDLDSDVFAVREEASRKLCAYGAKAESALRRVLAGAPSLEMRRQIEGILAALAPPVLRLPLAGDRLRGVRAIEVLERIATAEARRVLRAWAEQTSDVHLAIEARLALERLGPASAKLVKPPAAQNRGSP